ncbi:type II toxin-antitoxin system VapC family toxin [Isoptericola sp. NEAU-Y5]|uniref:Ribonuclease VapC n=1 Tax=Isoptericola luteus TaxID=2879484 RepID=A0ABS7ZH94_9MICO|nr:type II toxin-antitoxin system VapC family toxin [Isoptericola sp. NEAU-Y5]MCA5894398.1 type II toxin-antitoxin system VapC family toxin [Isoptericola sp. NEAU-Y5]
MALVYLDASALVKLCVPEQGSELAAALWNRADLVVTSRVSDTEVRAALAAGERAGVIDPLTRRRGVGRWDELWPAIAILEVSPQVSADAADLIATCPVPLRGADALHVASALALAHDDTVVAAWDAGVAGGARSRGLRVLP